MLTTLIFYKNIYYIIKYADRCEWKPIKYSIKVGEYISQDTLHRITLRFIYIYGSVAIQEINI